MPGLLIDVDKLEKYGMDNLINFFVKVPKTQNNVGVVFIINQNIMDNLKKMNNKITYLNSFDFINNIKHTYFVVYDKKKNLIEMRYSTPYLDDILHALLLYTPIGTTIWTGIINSNITDKYLKVGFNHPYITDKSPLGYKFSKSGLAFYKENIPRDKVDLYSAKNMLKYIEDKQQDRKCFLYVRFTPNAIRYLYRLNKPTASIIKNKKLYEKELAGSLKVRKVVNINGKIVFELSADPKSVKSGLEEEVDAVWSRYNFHTHPKKAYVNHNVTNGWPSSQDYLGFVQLNKDTIFHTVVTLEGIYIISYNPEWKGKVERIDHNYILKHYDINHNKNISYEQYVNIINNKKYKRGPPLFVVKYIPWDGDTSQVFPIFYAKTGGNCLATDEVFDNYKKYYSRVVK